MREREDANRTREAGHRDEIQGVVANTLKLYRNEAVGFIGWLDEWCAMLPDVNSASDCQDANKPERRKREQ